MLLPPLHKTSVEPDVILTFVNPAQLLVLLHAYTWNSSEPPRTQLFSEGGTCSAISIPYVTNKGCLSMPCYGTRALGLAQDDEVIFSLPVYLLSEIMENLKHVALASAYPIRQHVAVTPGPPFIHLISKEPPKVLRQRLKS